MVSTSRVTSPPILPFDVSAFSLPAANKWFTAPVGSSLSTTTRTLTDGQIFGYPIPIPRTLTVDAVAVHVTTVATVEEAEIGFYNAGADYYASSLLQDIGGINIQSPGFQTLAITPARRLMGGTLRWAVISFTGASGIGVLAAHAAGSLHSLLGFTNDFTSAAIVGVQASNGGVAALPSTFPNNWNTASLLRGNATQFIIGLHVASIP